MEYLVLYKRHKSPTSLDSRLEAVVWHFLIIIKKALLHDSGPCGVHPAQGNGPPLSDKGLQGNSMKKLLMENKLIGREYEM